MALKRRVLFLCYKNEARSQIAEAFLNSLAGDRFEAYSGGQEAGELNQYAVRAMSEIGIDISQNHSKKAIKFFQDGKTYNYVITIWDNAKDATHPVFPGVTQRAYWTIDDIAKFDSLDEEGKMEKMRSIRDEIKQKVIDWSNNPHEEDYRDPIALTLRG